VAVYKAESFSAIYQYRLAAAVTEYSLGATAEPYGVTTDADGNIYVSLNAAGVKKITPDGTVSDYASHAAGVAKWSAMKMGPGGVLYTARILKAIYQTPAGGGTPVLWVTAGLGNKIYDLDFDAEDNVWACGDNAAIYRVKADKSVKAFAFACNARSIRVYSGYVYVGGLVGTTEEGVWRAQIINADSLGAFEKYCDFSAAYSGKVNAITFAADGDMYIGTDAAEAIIVVHPSKTAEALYPGLFTPATLLFAWGKTDDMYAVRSVNTPKLIKITMLKNGAPYYGVQ
jgi:streptogramin lyase